MLPGMFCVTKRNGGGGVWGYPPPGSMNIKTPTRVIYSSGEWPANERSGRERSSVDDPVPQPGQRFTLKGDSLQP